MSEEQLIHHMETWIFRAAQVRWGRTPAEVVELFKKYRIFEYITECYDYLHLSSYECALENVETLLRNHGVIVNGKA